MPKNKSSAKAKKAYGRKEQGGGGSLARVRVLGGDTECPLQVCQSSRSSESARFRSLRRDVLIALLDSTRAPDGFRDRRHVPPISDLFPDYPQYKSPTLSYETHPSYLNYG